MCNLSAGVEARGIEKGVTKTYLANIKSLMVELKLTADEAMDMLHVPKEDRLKYRAALAGNDGR